MTVNIAPLYPVDSIFLVLPTISLRSIPGPDSVILWMVAIAVAFGLQAVHGKLPRRARGAVPHHLVQLLCGFALATCFVVATGLLLANGLSDFDSLAGSPWHAPALAAGCATMVIGFLYTAVLVHAVASVAARQRRSAR